MTALRAAIRSQLDDIDRVDFYTSDRGEGAEASIRMLEPGVTVLTHKSAIGLEFDAVYLADVEVYLPCATAEDRRTMYMLCARARDALVIVDGPSHLGSRHLDALPPHPTLER